MRGPAAFHAWKACRAARAPYAAAPTASPATSGVVCMPGGGEQEGWGESSRGPGSKSYWGADEQAVHGAGALGGWAAARRLAAGGGRPRQASRWGFSKLLARLLLPMESRVGSISEQSSSGEERESAMSLTMLFLQALRK